MMVFSRKAAIRLFCLDCQSGSCKAVRLCESEGCYLHEFRRGRVSRKTSQKALKTEKKVLVNTKQPIRKDNGFNDSKRAETFLKSLGHGKSIVELERDGLE